MSANDQIKGIWLAVVADGRVVRIFLHRWFGSATLEQEIERLNKLAASQDIAIEYRVHVN